MSAERVVCNRALVDDNGFISTCQRLGTEPDEMGRLICTPCADRHAARVLRSYGALVWALNREEVCDDDQ